MTNTAAMRLLVIKKKKKKNNLKSFSVTEKNVFCFFIYYSAEIMFRKKMKMIVVLFEFLNLKILHKFLLII